MIVAASYKNARISSQKLKPILDKIRGLKIDYALNILKFSNKKSAYLIKKLLKSVVANAINNNSLDINNLYVYQIYSTKATSFKRLNIRARGRSDRMIKRNAHIFIRIKEKV